MCVCVCVCVCCNDFFSFPLSKIGTCGERGNAADLHFLFPYQFFSLFIFFLSITFGERGPSFEMLEIQNKFSFSFLSKKNFGESGPSFEMLKIQMIFSVLFFSKKHLWSERP